MKARAIPIAARSLLAAVGTALVLPAMADPVYSVIALTFENILVVDPVLRLIPEAEVRAFYDGGRSAAGTTGPDYNVSFSAGAAAFHKILPGYLGTGAFNAAPSGSAALGFEKGRTSVIVNVEQGFEVGFATRYAATNDGLRIAAFSGLDGQGTRLNEIALQRTPPFCSPAAQLLCTWETAAFAFQGTAHSLVIENANEQVYLDNFTLGDTTPQDRSIEVRPAIPEPSTYALLALGLGLTGLAARKRLGRGRG